MTADLSLSRSLGGLRIANPDEDDASTPPEILGALAPTLDATARAPPVTTSQDATSVSSRSPGEPSPPSRRLSFFNLLRGRESPGEQVAASRTPPLGATMDSPRDVSSTSAAVPISRAMESAERIAPSKPSRASMPLNHQAQQQAQFQPYQTSGPSGLHRAQPSVGPSQTIPSGLYAAAPPSAVYKAKEPTYRTPGDGPGSNSAGLSRSNSRGARAMQAGVPSREMEHRDRSYGSQSTSNPGPMPRRSSQTVAGTTSETQAVTLNTTGLTESEKLSSANTEDRGAATGLREEIDEHGNRVLRKVQKGVRDFIFGRTLGEGSYSTVVLATDRQTLKEYAVKILDKKHIIQEKKVKYVNIEKDTLNRLIEHPGIIRLYYTFQDASSLYYVLDMASAGELLGVLKKTGSFDVECTRFYGGQILCAIEHMHSRGVIHRDLKPENVLLDDQMHIKITDFGTAKLLHDPRKPLGPAEQQQMPELTRAKSFVGTAEYVSPELLTDKSACKASDLWAFGCILFQLLSGRPPFKAANEYLTFQKIVNLEYEFPPGFPSAAKDLVERLLVLDPQMRLSMEHIKNHEFFNGLQISTKLWRMKAPRLKPYIPSIDHASPSNHSDVDAANLSPAHFSGQSAPTTHGTGNGHGNGKASSRPQPRVITELPPPTQLDIEWSPVLTRDNERILKLGNLMVLTSPIVNGHTPKQGDDGQRKGLSRFFGGSTTKKRQRLVIVTSSARLIFAASGGDEKKKKSEISLLEPDCAWRTQVDVKGQTVFCVDNRGTHYTFEDVKAAPSSIEPPKTSAEDWIEAMERARDIALSQSMVGTYHSDGGFDMSSSRSSPSSTLHDTIYPKSSDRARNALSRSQASLHDDGAETKKKTHRFSKRQSKNGLATPF